MQRNVPSLYAYAKEIPVLGEFVRALHVGGGGESTRHEDIEIEISDSELVLHFIDKGRTTDTVAPYEVQYHSAPSRIALTLQSLTEEEYGKLESGIRSMNGVEDVYRTQAEGKDEISFAIVLDRLYDYEVIEQIFPGMLSIRLFQDAYYTAEERAPEQKVYYLRTEGMEQDEEFRSLLVKYRAESPAQVKTQEGSFILTIGEFASEEEAENRLAELQKNYGGAAEFRVSSGMAKEVPEK